MPVMVQSSEAISAATRADSWLPLRNVYGESDGTWTLYQPSVSSCRMRGMLPESALTNWASKPAYRPGMRGCMI
jgi:hypothetical protein